MPAKVSGRSPLCFLDWQAILLLQCISGSQELLERLLVQNWLVDSIGASSGSLTQPEQEEHRKTSDGKPSRQEQS